jgi:hypothetical protein
VLTLLYVGNQWRQGKSEIQSLTSLENELDAGDAEVGEVGEEKEETAT